MKKLYALFISLIFTGLSFGQVIITELADPDNNAAARYVEIYCVGPSSVDLTGWELRRWTNGNIDPQPSGIDLSSLGTLAVGDYAIIAANGTEFQSVYGFAADIDAGTAGAADSNGDDQIAIFDGADSTIDIFGVPGEDGSNTCHEFEDGRAERAAAVTGPNATFDEAEWNVWADTAVSGCTNHTNAVRNAPGDFDPGSWIGDPSSCNVSFGSVTYTCSTNTAGDNNDGVTINISYSGSDAGITSVITNSVGTVGGDDPSSIADGTITISGLSEGDAWDVVLNGGNCAGNSTSGTVPSDECDPAPNTCFDISNGAELFELVVVTPNSDSDEWQYAAGNYSMNGFCGSGCTEQIETWLIFGPLDLTAVTDLDLAFDAAESFGTTDLVVAYTDSYSGCPSGSSWTTAQTISAAGAYEIDLSAASGTDVFIGIQYADDGVDGYSSWTLSNVALEAFGSCPTLGSRPTSNCAVCDVILQSENIVCMTNTAGTNNDMVTIEIPYTGFDDTMVSVSTTSGGTVGGDDPWLVTDGTITLTGLMEGSAWDITLNGGDCDGTTVSGTVPSTLCDPFSCPSVGDIIITEVMQNPSAVGDTAGEWFEVYNTTAGPIDLNGWEVSDLGSDSFTITSSVVVPAGGYAVLGNNANMTTNGGVMLDYEYSGMTLSNGDDEIILQCSSVTIDEIAYDGGPNWPDPTGASMELSITALDNISNDTGSNWGVGSSAYGDGDLGTPGAANDFTLSVDSFNVNEFKLFPNPNGTGELQIIGLQGDDLKVEIFDLLGKRVISAEDINQTLDVSTLTDGLYMVKLTQGSNSTIKKLIIK